MKTKTIDEFLEDLRSYVNEKWLQFGGDYLHILNKIEQFEAEQKVTDENKA